MDTALRSPRHALLAELKRRLAGSVRSFEPSAEEPSSVLSWWKPGTIGEFLCDRPGSGAAVVAWCSLFGWLSREGAVKDFRDGGTATIIAESNGESATLPVWATRVINWLCERTPQDFGYFRSRWSCATLAEVLAWETGHRVSAETVRRVLQTAGYVWRRPRPVVGPEDPHYIEKLRRIQQLLEHLPPDETAVFPDEVDVHLNPKIGSMWMPRGQQAEVVTPGNNEKCHVAGSLVWRTGTLIASPPGLRRNSELFLDHLDELRRRLRGFQKIHVICDNAAFHKSRLVWEYLERWKDRIVLHFLPCYAPETNPIERIWWRMHETITRNHRCPTLTDLVDQVYQWFEQQRTFVTQTLTHYAQAA